jgi:predicted nucleic acid-binding protein
VVVADTDILIDALERREPVAAARVRALASRGELLTTAVTLFELTAGPRTTAAQLELIQAELASVEVLPITRGSADLAAAASRVLGRRGRGVALPDTLIAAVCIEHGHPLLTRNRAHFERFLPFGLVLA